MGVKKISLENFSFIHSSLSPHLLHFCFVTSLVLLEFWATYTTCVSIVAFMTVNLVLQFPFVMLFSYRREVTPSSYFLAHNWLLFSLQDFSFFIEISFSEKVWLPPIFTQKDYPLKKNVSHKRWSIALLCNAMLPSAYKHVPCFSITWYFTFFQIVISFQLTLEWRCGQKSFDEWFRISFSG